MTLLPNALRACFVFACLCCAMRAAGAETMKIQFERVTQDPVLVGQRVEMNITLMTPTTFGSAPAFDLPEVPGVILMHVDDRPVLGSQQVGDESYVTQLHQLVLYCMKPGHHDIPEFTIRIASPPKFGAPPEDHRLTVSAFSIEATMPPGTENLPGIICSKDLSVKETWSPEPAATATVGDSVTRTVTLSTPDVAGMAMPPVPLDKVAGLSAYPQPPSVDDHIDRGTFIGKRIDRAVFVFEHEGHVEFPAIEIPWWNLDTNTLEKTTLPARSIEVVARKKAAGTPVSEATTSQPLSRFSKANLLVWLVFAALVIVAGILVWRRRDTCLTTWNAWRSKRAATEAGRFEQLETACRRGDARATYRALVEWLQCFHHGADAATVDADLPGYHSDDRLRNQIDSLQAAVLDNRHHWDAAGLLQTFERVRRERLQSTRRLTAKTLPPLNPAMSQ